MKIVAVLRKFTISLLERLFSIRPISLSIIYDQVSVYNNFFDFVLNVTPILKNQKVIIDIQFIYLENYRTLHFPMFTSRRLLIIL